MLPRTNRERLVVSMRVSWQSRVRATREKDGQVVRWQVGGRLLETGGRTLKVPVMVRERTWMREEMGNTVIWWVPTTMKEVSSSEKRIWRIVWSSRYVVSSERRGVGPPRSGSSHSWPRAARPWDRSRRWAGQRSGGIAGPRDSCSRWSGAGLQLAPGPSCTGRAAYGCCGLPRNGFLWSP